MGCSTSKDTVGDSLELSGPSTSAGSPATGASPARAGRRASSSKVRGGLVAFTSSLTPAAPTAKVRKAPVVTGDDAFDTPVTSRRAILEASGEWAREALNPPCGRGAHVVPNPLREPTLRPSPPLGPDRPGTSSGSPSSVAPSHNAALAAHAGHQVKLRVVTEWLAESGAPPATCATTSA